MTTTAIVRISKMLLRVSVALVGMAPACFAGIAGGSADLVLGQNGYTRNGVNYIESNDIVSPSAVAVDAATGRVYVCDTVSKRVLWWNNKSSLTNGKAADGVLGQPDFNSLISTCTQSSVGSPWAVAVDSASNVWVTDMLYERVLKFSMPATNGQAASLVLGQPDFSSYGAACSQTRLDDPMGVAVDGSGNVWVADRGNHRVLKFEAPSSNGQAATLVLGQANFTTEFAANAQDGLNQPISVCVDSSNNIWVADCNNHRILKYAVPVSSGQAAELVLGQPDFTSATPGDTAAKLNQPYGVSVDNAGNVWAADSQNCRVVKYAVPLSSGQAAALALGQVNLTSNVSACTQTGLNYPNGVAVDSAGDIWVADENNRRVLRYAAPAASGQAAALVLGQADFTHSLFSNGQGFYNPYAIAVNNTSGRVYVSDKINNRVLWWNSMSALTDGKAADGVLGQPDVYSDSASSQRTGMWRPEGVAVDSAGNVWVADTSNNRVLKFAEPQSSGASPVLVLGQQTFTAVGAACSSAGLFAPSGIAVDGADNVWIADKGNSRVLKFTAPGASGQAASLVLGQANFTSSGTATTQTGLYEPSGVTVDAAGNVWVADSYNNRVLKFAVPDTNGQAATIVLGQTNFSLRTVNWTQTGMNYPAGVDLDPAGNVWVADQFNNRVLKYTLPVSSSQAASLALGQADFTSNVGACTQTGMYRPAGVTLDSAGHVWVADRDNNRVLKFSALAVKSVSPDNAINAGTVSLTVSGFEFVAGSSVTLTKAGQADILATNVAVANATTITCVLDLTGKATGYWNVCVSTGGSGSSVYLINGFLVRNGAKGTVNTNSSASMSFNSAYGPVTLDISANTFSENVVMTMTESAVPPANQSGLKMSLIGLEITNDKSLQPLKDMILTITYRDADIAGLNENKLTLAYYDTALARWAILPTTVDTARKLLTARVTHLSLFAVVQVTSAADLGGVKAYPMPFNPARGRMTIDNLTDTAVIKLFTITGELVRTVAYDDASGKASWDGRNDGGNTVASGVYIMYITSPQGSKKLKIAVEK